MKLFEIPYLPPHIQIKKKNSLKSLHLVKISLIKNFAFFYTKNRIILYNLVYFNVKMHNFYTLIAENVLKRF